MQKFYPNASIAIHHGFNLLFILFSSQVERESCFLENDPNACTKCDASLNLEL